MDPQRKRTTYENQPIKVKRAQIPPYSKRRRLVCIKNKSLLSSASNQKEKRKVFFLFHSEGFLPFSLCKDTNGSAPAANPPRSRITAAGGATTKHGDVGRTWRSGARGGEGRVWRGLLEAAAVGIFSAKNVKVLGPFGLRVWWFIFGSLGFLIWAVILYWTVLLFVFVFWFCMCMGPGKFGPVQLRKSFIII
ncbi:hypothetical protein E1A91_A09G137400v1 [Gossypium mustelinum]|uniref:Uncharacterized protein n=1 Tax=Gossypium mustelinum TaxID=34275 RepID=A0A5D2XXS9_GOSMU|nr:hypothetical protein E1A91_A09G137400v1 [Gossypium mustelinum]